MAAGNNPRVWAIVLNWNNYSQTKLCLESLRRASYPNLRVVVVDNASDDNSGKRLQSEFSDYDFVFNEQNLGFARGCNRGIRAAQDDPECAFALLVNNDLEVEPSFLEPAVDAAEQD